MILYFSGTGNSLYVAKKLAELTGDTAVPISAIHERCQRIQDRIIGFVFPVYFGDLPEPVQDFVRQVRFQKSTYFYGVATCGSTAGRALKTMDRILQRQHCSLSYGIVLPMIANSTIASRRHIHYDTNRLDHADELIAAAADKIRGQIRYTGAIRSSASAWLMNLGLVRRAGERWLTPSVDGNRCIACGLCARICPVSNIICTAERAVIGSHCSYCLACVHWCPRQAVTVHGKQVLSEDQYHHPDVTAEDMTRR